MEKIFAEIVDFSLHLITILLAWCLLGRWKKYVVIFCGKQRSTENKLKRAGKEPLTAKAFLRMSAKTNRVTFAMRNYNFLIFTRVGPSFSWAYNIQDRCQVFILLNLWSLSIYLEFYWNRQKTGVLYSIGMLASMEESSWECFIHDTSSYFFKIQHNLNL